MKANSAPEASLSHRAFEVRIDSLLAADSPRLDGMNEQHVRRLAGMFPALPPLLVHRTTLRVVDGMHRLAAARALGLRSVEVRYFDGTPEEGFLRSVSANVAHGLPLTVADRKAAAARILGSHPELSDRAVAAHVGVDPKTVAAIRRGSTEENPQSNLRVGMDGRAHPLDRTAERLRAAELMTRRPDLPLRAIVKETGISLGTAHDVRQRLLRGEEPIPRGRRTAGSTPGSAPASAAGRPGANAAAPLGPRPPAVAAARPAPPPPDPVRAYPPDPARAQGPYAAQGLSGRSRASLEALGRLVRDPSLRHSESGRQFLRWLNTHFVVDDAWRQQADAVPPHCTDAVAELALQCSRTWQRFAEDLSRRRLTDMASAPEWRAASDSRH
ncbi:ParB/RepB/Spo0J family partition protein (plasmid) [Streptomyces goshikiensis]|nr:MULTISPECIES: ParB/RepB/Spo0J family partition protein [Streptomyces]AKL71164.1 transcriptional regulator [Streptomyces sp. Mg1]WBY24868.1 ParB/RepB/Spo0J family partition protein [Streptomyces goshikiensis]WSS04068.1 ParB/RepB/Spo0J family partition protein [Streptomyces goshikiensis]